MRERKRARYAPSPAPPAAGHGEDQAMPRRGEVEAERSVANDTYEPPFMAVVLMGVLGAILFASAFGAFGDHIHQARRW